MLSELPRGSRGLDDTYNNALGRIDDQSADRAELGRRVISWILNAVGPLSMRDLQYAFAIETGDTHIDVENVMDPEIILSVCCGLVIFDEHSRRVRLVHYTAMEYFRRRPDAWITDAQLDMAKICITCISFDIETWEDPMELLEFDDDDDDIYLTKDKVALQQELWKYPFLNWAHHLQFVEDLEAMSGMLLDLLGCEWRLDYLGCTVPGDEILAGMINVESGWEEGNQHWNGSLILAHYGLDHALTWWLEKGGAADVKIEKHETPLTLAIRQGHESTVRLLLSRTDVDVNHMVSEHDGDCPPLSLAIEKGHESIVRLLLSRTDVDILHKVSNYDYEDFPPLAQAIFEEHESIVRLLLSRTDVDVNHIVADPDGDNYCLCPPLHMAIRRDLSGIVKLLLERLDTDVNWRDPESNKTALHFAISDCHGAEIVEALISRKDLEADAQTADGDTPLSLAVEAGQPDIVRLLLTRKDVQRKSS